MWLLDDVNSTDPISAKQRSIFIRSYSRFQTMAAMAYDLEGDASPAALSKDEALALAGEEKHSIDPLIAARALRKIDWFLMPAMIVGCSSPSSITSQTDF